MVLPAMLPTRRTQRGALLVDLLISVLLATAFLIAALRVLSGQSGVVRVADNQVSVETNYWSG